MQNYYQVHENPFNAILLVRNTRFHNLRVLHTGKAITLIDIFNCTFLDRVPSVYATRACQQMNVYVNTQLTD